MEFLPAEVISHIFQFLPSLEDRKAASCVCRLWYEAYQSLVFRLDEVVEVKAEEWFKDLLQLQNPNRKFFNVVTRAIDISTSSSAFWERFGPHIRCLWILSCCIEEKTFVDVLRNCTRLEALCVQDSWELMMPGRLLEDEEDRKLLRERFLNLKSLDLGYNRYLSDAVFVRFGLLCPNIEELQLPGCHISFHSGLYKRFYSKNGESTPSESVLTFSMIYRFIQGHANKLKRLSFNETLIDSVAVSLIAETADLSLESLCLRQCQQLSNDGVIKLTNFQTTLTHLDLALCPRVTDMSLIVICSRLGLLKSLSIQGCRAITDLGISDLWRLVKLTRLNISECELIHDDGIIKGLCTEKNSNLEELYLSHLGDITEESVLQLTEHQPNLRVLDLGFCYNAVTDKSVQSIISKSKRLRSLILTMSENLTDRGLTGITVSTAVTKTLRIPLGSRAEISIIRDAKIKQEIENAGNQTGSPISSLRKLQNLNLAGCSRISDVSLKHAFRFEDLRSLDLGFCDQLTDEGFSVVIDHNKSIENLNLDGCPNIGVDGLVYMYKNLKRLRTLTLGSKRVTEDLIKTLCESINLSFLDVRHCARLTAASIAYIKKIRPRIRVYHFANDEFLQPPPSPPPPPVC